MIARERARHFAGYASRKFLLDSLANKGISANFFVTGRTFCHARDAGIPPLFDSFARPARGLVEKDRRAITPKSRDYSHRKREDS
jgi:hypothetical protein